MIGYGFCTLVLNWVRFFLKYTNIALNIGLNWETRQVLNKASDFWSGHE